MSGTHEVQIHSSYIDLPHIDAVLRWTEAQDGECFGDLADVLLDYRAEERFAITLLHHHFPVYASEFVLSWFDSAGALLTSPRESAACSSAITVPSAWRISRHNDSFVPTPIEWAIVAAKDLPRFLLTPVDVALFFRLGSALDKHGALGRFGFRLAEIAPRSEPGTLIVETTHAEERMLRLAPEPVTAPGLENAVQTSWQIIEVEHPYQAGFWCKKRTTTYCSAYCKTSCRGVGGEYGFHDVTHNGEYHSKSSSTTHYE